MKRILFYLLPIIVLLSSCQKEDLLTKEELLSSDNVNESTLKKSVATTDAEIQTNTQPIYGDEIIVTAAAAPTPNINGEIQLFLNKAVSYPVSVQFKIKETLKMGDNLVSGYFTIPANQRYLMCDIDEYIKNSQGRPEILDSTDSNGILWVYETSPDIISKLISPYLQIWNVEVQSSNIKILANYSILKITHSLDGVSISYPLKAGTVPISTLSNISGITFYKPTTGGGTDPIVPVDPIDSFRPIE